MDAQAAHRALAIWPSKPQMIDLEGTREFLRGHGVPADAVDAFVADETPFVRLKEGREYVRRMQAVAEWPGLPWPSQCKGCDAVLPKKCFNVVLKDAHKLFPAKCVLCVRRSKLASPSAPIVDPELEEDVARAVRACAIDVDHKDHIVKVAGLAELGLDTSRIARDDVVPWGGDDWVKVLDARRVFGADSRVPKLCRGATCKRTHADGVVKLSSAFPAAGSCKVCRGASDATHRAGAAAARSADRLKTCAVCQKDKPETAFEVWRRDCTSCRNRAQTARSLDRASTSADQKKCSGCARLVPADGPNSCDGCLAKNARNDARPERREYHRQLQQQNGTRYSREYRKRQREEDEEAFLARNAKRMREYVERNWERIAEWRANWPGTRVWSLRKHQRELDEAGIVTPADEAITDAEIKALIAGVCFYCGASENAGGGALGVDRLDSNVGYPRRNCVAACASCNMSKRTVSAPEYVARAKWMSSFGGVEARSDPSIWHDYEPTPWMEFSKRVQQVGGDLDEAAYDELIRGPCTYCERDVSTGVDRVDNERGYWVADNVVSCCGCCNFAKWCEDVDAFLARMDAIARRHIEMPELLGGIGAVAVNTSVRRLPIDMDESGNHGGGGGDGDYNARVVRQPEDLEAFWAGLDWRETETTIFVRVAAFTPYAEGVDAFVKGLKGNIRYVKPLTYGATGEQEMYVNIARAKDVYKELPWPKRCKGPCGIIKPFQDFSKNGPSRSAMCKECSKLNYQDGRGRASTEASRAAAAERKRRSRAKASSIAPVGK